MFGSASASEQRVETYQQRRLPTAIISKIFAMLEMHDNIQLSKTSTLMRTIAQLLSSSPAQVTLVDWSVDNIYRSITREPLDKRDDKCETKTDDGNKRSRVNGCTSERVDGGGESFWRMQPIKVETGDYIARLKLAKVFNTLPLLLKNAEVLDVSDRFSDCVPDRLFPPFAYEQLQTFRNLSNRATIELALSGGLDAINALGVSGKREWSRMTSLQTAHFGSANLDEFKSFPPQLTHLQVGGVSQLLRYRIANDEDYKRFDKLRQLPLVKLNCGILWTSVCTPKFVEKFVDNLPTLTDLKLELYPRTPLHNGQPFAWPKFNGPLTKLTLNYVFSPLMTLVQNNSAITTLHLFYTNQPDQLLGLKNVLNHQHLPSLTELSIENCDSSSVPKLLESNFSATSDAVNTMTEQISQLVQLEKLKLSVHNQLISSFEFLNSLTKLCTLIIERPHFDKTHEQFCCLAKEKKQSQLSARRFEKIKLPNLRELTWGESADEYSLVELLTIFPQLTRLNVRVCQKDESSYANFFNSNQFFTDHSTKFALNILDIRTKDCDHRSNRASESHTKSPAECCQLPPETLSSCVNGALKVLAASGSLETIVISRPWCAVARQPETAAKEWFGSEECTRIEANLADLGISILGVRSNS